MALTSNYLQYTTDDDKVVTVNLKYEDEGNEDRLTTGGFTAQYRIAEGCRVTMSRKRIKPRYCDTTNKGRVYFRTHALWKTYISVNKATVIKACGECLSCTVINFIY